MRRRPPHQICLSQEEHQQLHQLLRDGRTQQRMARRARVLLAMADPATVVSSLSEQVAMTRSGIWRLCRRYERVGLAMLEDAPRSGHPRQFSPLSAGAG